MTALHFAAARLAQLQPQPVLEPRFDQFIAPQGGVKLKPGTGWRKGDDGSVLPLQGVSIDVHTWQTWGQN